MIKKTEHSPSVWPIESNTIKWIGEERLKIALIKFDLINKKINHDKKITLGNPDKESSID